MGDPFFFFPVEFTGYYWLPLFFSPVFAEGFPFFIQIEVIPFLYHFGGRDVSVSLLLDWLIFFFVRHGVPFLVGWWGRLGFLSEWQFSLFTRGRGL